MVESGAGSETTGESRSVNFPAVPPTMLFGKYEVGKLVGCGAFAKVYHAREARTGKSVAIKAVSKQRLQKGGLAAHAKREVAIMHRLRHPHIVRLFEVLATKTKIYFVMEFAKGGELFARVSKGRFSEDLSRRYFQQLISAVGYCHSRGVFHRDLKPENLLLDEKLNLKVADFGLSAVTEQIHSDGLLHTLCGTPAYVAPEVLEKKGYNGAKIDVWSCGVVLFVLNAGYLPFNDANLMALYRKIYKGEFRVPKWTSPELRRLLHRILDTNPNTRITVDEIIKDPWFKQGFDEKMTKFHLEEFDLKLSGDQDEQSIKRLNAFDIISRSPSFCLSGLFRDVDTSSDCRSERFVSAESPARIVEKVGEIATAENLMVTKKEIWGMKIQGQKGNFTIVIDIHRLTDELVMVEIKKRQPEDGDFWREKVQPQLNDLVYQQVEPVSGHTDELAL